MSTFAVVLVLTVVAPVAVLVGRRAAHRHGQAPLAGPSVPGADPFVDRDTVRARADLSAIAARSDWAPPLVPLPRRPVEPRAALHHRPRLSRRERQVTG